MSIKIKNTDKTIERLGNVASQIGIVLMSAAATLGMLEMPDHSRTQVVVPSRAVFAFATENNDPANSLRRERDEAAPHYVSYNETQRTPSRSGKR